MTTQGVVIKLRPIGETDQIATVLSKQLGVVEVVVPRTRRASNALSGACQILSYANFVLYKGKRNYRVNSADLIESFYPIRLDVTKASLAGYFCELANFISPTGETAEALLRLLLNCLHMLSADKRNIMQIKSIFELRACTIAGYMPDLVCCRGCRCYEAETMFLDMQRGYIMCENCCADEGVSPEGCVELKAPILMAMRHIIYAELEKLFSFTLSEEGLRQLERITERYVLTHTEKTFKSLEVYRSVL